MRKILNIFYQIAQKKSYTIWLLIITGYVVFINSLGNQMFWDDLDNITNNRYVHDLAFFPNYFSENLLAGSSLGSNYWRPAMLTVWALEYALWGNFSAGFRFINISLHISSAILIYFLLNKLFKKPAISLIISMIFLVHPLQTEAITYISGISDPLSTLFMISGLLFGLTAVSKEFGIRPLLLLFSALSFVLALMTRETTLIILPSLLVLSLFFYLDKRINFRQIFLIIFRVIWPYLLIGTIYFLLRASVLNFGGTFNLYETQNEYTQSILLRFLTFLRVLSEYVLLLIYPHDLHMERTVLIARSILEPGVLVGFGLLLGMILTGFLTLRKFSVISFGIFWFLVTLFPISNILIPVNSIMYEHWLYLPMIGFFLSLIYGLYLIYLRLPKVLPLFLGVLILYISFLSVKTMVRNTEWADPIKFYNQVLRYSPDSLRVLNNLGMSYAETGDNQNAIKTYGKAITIDPKNSVPYHNLGNSYKALKQFDLAITNFEKAIELQPNFVFSYNSMTDLYLGQKDYGNAKKTMARLLNHTSNKFAIYFSLAQIAVMEKNYPEALEYLREAQVLDPTNQDIMAAIAEVEGIIKTSGKK